VKYNHRQYKKVNNYKPHYIEIPHNYSFHDYKRDTLDVPKVNRLIFINGKFRNMKYYTKRDQQGSHKIKK